MSPPLAGEANCRRVDDWHHLAEMVVHHAIEQRLIPLLQRDQINVFLQIVRLAAETLQHAVDLFGLGVDAGRDEATESERVALGGGERRAFVEQRIVK